MREPNYLIIHSDHPLHVDGVNSGAENATLALARALGKTGRRVVLCGRLPEGEKTSAGVECWDLGTTYDVAEALQRAEREMGSFHLVAACRALPILVSRGRRSVLSRTFMAHDPTSGALGVKPAILSEVADNLVCVSTAQKELFLSEGADPRNLHVVPNGADLSVFHPGPDERRSYRRLVFVGALVLHKGVDLLLEAFTALKNRHPDLLLDVYGSAYPFSALRSVECSSNSRNLRELSASIESAEHRKNQSIRFPLRTPQAFFEGRRSIDTLGRAEKG